MTALEIRRVPGLSRPFELAALSPGLNIIHGPNASGKTTTARAIASLLWPRAATGGPASLSGRFTLAGSEWLVDLDAGRIRYQRAGIDAGAPSLSPAEARDRYHLSLHDLLSADNSELAREILRESAGGYDLGEAARTLKIRNAPSRAGREVEALRQARQALEEARVHHEELRRDEERLAELQGRGDAAEAAAARLRLLDLAIQHAEAVAAEELARREFAIHPKELEKMLGDEAERLATIRARLGEAGERLALAEQRCQQAARAIDAAGIPAAVLSGAEHGSIELILPALRQHIEGVRSHDHALRTGEEARERAEARRAEALRVLGEGIDDELLRRIDRTAMDELSGFAREADTIRAEHAAALASLEILGDEPLPLDLERLGEGERVLRQWLRSAPPLKGTEQRLRSLGISAAALLVLAGLFSGFLHPGFFLFAACGVLLALLVARSRQRDDLRATYRTDYERLGLEPPVDWTDEGVDSRLQELRKQIVAGRAIEDRIRRREEAEVRLSAAEARLAPIERRRQELVDWFGVAPGTSAATLFWIADRIARWQEAEGEVRSAQAAMEVAGRQRAADLKSAATLVAGFGLPAPASLAELVAAATAIEGRIQAQGQGIRDMEAGERERTVAAREINELKAERATILQRFGADIDEEDIVRWSADLAAYTGARRTLLTAEEGRRAAAARLESAAGPDAELAELGLERLVSARLEAATAAEELGEIRREIGMIESRLAEARRRHDAEAAIAAADRARDQLRDLRDADATAMVGSSLVEFLQKTTRDQHRPAVFHLARDLFGRITSGRYRLDFDSDDPPAFRAYDNSTGIGHSLDELSSATRVQLLLAVRIAFIEELETGARLPLLFDETLGNSDDQRAAAIIAATCTLAADGRQIFYFTAQPDEVEKWRTILAENSESSASFIDLAELRRIAAYREIPRISRQVGTLIPPAPAGLGHQEYGELLLVPPIDLTSDLGATHLWYLIEDPEALHQLLRLGVETWGALEFIAQQKTTAPFGLDDITIARISAAARALQTALDLARIGQSRTVDREVLLESGAITNTFIDRVDDLSRAANGEPAILLDELERLPRFRADSREALRTFLEDRGYLDYREPIEPALIRLRTIDVVMNEIQQGLITIDQIERLLGRLPIPVPA
jgi:hypothetical protein